MTGSRQRTSGCSLSSTAPGPRAPARRHGPASRPRARAAAAIRRPARRPVGMHASARRSASRGPEEEGVPRRRRVVAPVPAISAGRSGSVAGPPRSPRRGRQRIDRDRRGEIGTYWAARCQVERAQLDAAQGLARGRPQGRTVDGCLRAARTGSRRAPERAQCQARPRSSSVSSMRITVADRSAGRDAQASDSPAGESASSRFPRRRGPGPAGTRRSARGRRRAGG
jgi:hypothetical protein